MTLSYRFGEFRLDPATRELWRGDTAVAVPPRAFDCIVYLVEHRERAVGRDELIAAVWGRTEIGDGMLGQTVLSARRALEDTGKEQHVIRTVFRFGYHWVAAVDVVDGQPAEALPADSSSSPALTPTAPLRHAAATAPGTVIEPVPPASQRRTPRWLFGIGIAALLGILAMLAVQRLHRADTTPRSTPASPASQGTVALVLPVTVSAGAGFDWVRLGMMDLIGARLRAAGLAVVPSDSVVALSRLATSADGADLATLARSAGATLVLDARAEAIGGQWRITLRTVWGRQPPLLASAEAGDVLAAARSAADQLARQLGYSPAPDNTTDTASPGLASLSQQIEAAILTDQLDGARALIASASPSQRAQPEIRLRLAQIDYQAGNLDTAEAGFNAVAAAVSAEQDAILHARALTQLGVIAAVRDNPVLATRRFEEAIALLRGEQAPDALGKALLGRANIAGSTDRYDAALQDFAEARIAFESSGNLLALAVLDSNLGALDLRRLRYAEAEPVFERAAARFATFGLHAADLNALTAAAELKLALLEPDAALAMDPRLRDLIAQVADPSRKRAGELTRVQILIANGRLGEAAASLRTVLDAAPGAKDRSALAHGHALAAQLAWERGDTRQSAAEADAALQGFTATDDTREHALTLRLRVAALLAEGQTAAARQSRDVLADFAERSGDAAARLYAHLATAECAAAAGDRTAADAYAQALAAADALRIPLDLREVAVAYTTWLVHTGELARAGATAERVAAWSTRDYASALLQLRVQSALGDETLRRNALARVDALAGERAVPPALRGTLSAP